MLSKLYYFYVVAKHEHVTRASEELHISQPALTKSIKLLEEELKVPLFKKEKRNVVLTQFGSFLKAKLDTVFPMLEEIPVELNRMKGVYENTVRLNVLAASSIVTEAIVEFKKENEDAVFHVIQNEEDADCDITVTTSPEPVRPLEDFQKLNRIEEEVYLAVPNDMECENEVDLRDFCEEGFVNLAGSRVYRTICDDFCRQSGFTPRIIFESDSIASVRNIIGAGAGIGFWPGFSWGDRSKDIRLLKITNIDCRREIMVGFHKNERKSLMSEKFYTYLTEFIQNKCISKNNFGKPTY